MTKGRKFKLHPMKEHIVGKVNECSESEALFLYLNNKAFRKVYFIFIYLIGITYKR